jgi:uncharacterized membrane protein (UPF0127 family)
MKHMSFLLGLVLLLAGCDGAPDPNRGSKVSDALIAPSSVSGQPGANPATTPSTTPTGDPASAPTADAGTKLDATKAAIQPELKKDLSTDKPTETPEVKKDEPTKKPDPKNNPDGKRTVSERSIQLYDLKKARIKVGARSFNYWIMDDDAKRAEGMMHLEASDVGDEEGMFFIFPDSAPRSFWMRNCHFDLDVAYVSASGKILNTERMFAYNDAGVASKGDAMYVIEMRYGMFAKHGIKVGQRVVVPESVVAK